MSVQEDQYEFNDQMSNYVKMNTELADKVKKGAYSNRTTPALISEFNTWYAGRAASRAQ
jgi:hypothetical protein